MLIISIILASTLIFLIRMDQDNIIAGSKVTKNTKALESDEHDNTKSFTKESNAEENDADDVTPKENIRTGPIETDRTMRALLYTGCSGSGATYTLSREILIAHGLNVTYFRWPEKHLINYAASKIDKMARIEAEKHKKKPKKDDIIYEKMKIINKRSSLHNEILFTKAYYPNVNVFKRLDFKFSGMLRKNKLDRSMCFVNDCFKAKRGIGSLGYSVFAENGTKEELCFHRRNIKGLKTKVYFFADKLKEFMLWDISRDKELIQSYSSITHPGKIQYYEDLYEFEYTADEDVFQKSFDAWHSLLSSLIGR